MRLSAARLAGLCLTGASLVGCNALQSQKAPPPAVQEVPPADTTAVGPLLEMMGALPQGDPARQAELFQRAKDAADLTPTTSNRLRYALALATPGHAGSNAVAAQRQLSELL